MEERIQKIISAAGVTSRRAAEDLILEGRVRVNGKVVTELGSKADPEKDHIKVDGKLINPQQPKAYIVLNKPVGYVTTMSDPEGRQTVQDLLKGVKVRVYPVGRLDYNTEGLLLLTNDGDFAHLITHPKYELPKTYLVKIKGVLNDEAINRLESGIFLTDGKTAPARVKRLRKEEANSWVEITIHEGKKRQVRRMIDHVGNSVIRLKRVRVGNLPLGNLPPGSYRHMTPEEVTMLRDMAEGKLREMREEAPTRRRVEADMRGRVTTGPVARVQGQGKTEMREAAGQVRGRVEAETRGRGEERRVTRDEGRETKSRPEGVRGKVSGTRGEERWTSNRPFSERGKARRTRDVRATTGPAARVQGRGKTEDARRSFAMAPRREATGAMHKARVARDVRTPTGPVAGVQGIERREAAGQIRGRVDAEKRGRITAGVSGKARETRGEARWPSNKPFSERGTIRGTRDVRATRGPAARVQGQGKTERREAPGQMRGRVEAEKRVKPRWTKDEGRERPRGATSVRGRTGEQRGEARWTGNKPFGVKRKTEGSTWRKPGTGSQRPNERRKPPTGRPRRPPR
jgi:23S rRNA pseudouridine2605 synthase